jgi:heme-degrading monooxygenase HmoA
MEDSMNDFQDFLTRDLAYVAIGEFKPGKFAEARDLYEQAVATYADGFKGAYLLQEPGSDRGISIILWKSVDDMEANQSALHEAILKKMAPLFAGVPQTAFYDVLCEIHAPEAS